MLKVNGNEAMFAKVLKRPFCGRACRYFGVTSRRVFDEKVNDLMRRLQGADKITPTQPMVDAVKDLETQEFGHPLERPSDCEIILAMIFIKSAYHNLPYTELSRRSGVNLKTIYNAASGDVIPQKEYEEASKKKSCSRLVYPIVTHWMLANMLRAVNITGEQLSKTLQMVHNILDWGLYFVSGGEKWYASPDEIRQFVYHIMETLNILDDKI